MGLSYPYTEDIVIIHAASWVGGHTLLTAVMTLYSNVSLTRGVDFFEVVSCD